MDPILLEDAQRVREALWALNHRFAGRRVLLTGAAGFLGTHFMHYFHALAEGGPGHAPAHVEAWDSFIRGTPDWLEPFRNNRTFLVKNVDVTRPLPPSGHFDFVIHAASIASPTYYRRYPIETMDANVIGLRQLLELAERDPVESLLYFSTSEIYGSPPPDAVPTTEDYPGHVSCTGPRACYDESKRFGETLCTAFAQTRGIPVKIARPFNNYGPGLKISDKRVIPDFFRSILAAKNPVILSDGSPTRTFCYITDAVTGYLQLLLSSEDGEAFNIGTEEPEISMLQLAQLCIDASGRSLAVELGRSGDPHYLTDNPQRRRPNIGKAKNRLGYSPKVGIEEGLSRTWAWYVANPAAEEA